jgi:hypothetical protein
MTTGTLVRPGADAPDVEHEGVAGRAISDSRNQMDSLAGQGDGQAFSHGLGRRPPYRARGTFGALTMA